VKVSNIEHFAAGNVALLVVKTKELTPKTDIIRACTTAVQR